MIQARVSIFSTGRAVFSTRVPSWAYLLCAVLFCVCLASEARAAATWPDDSDWIALTTSAGANVTDVAGDSGRGGKERDIVGDSTRPAGYWFYSAANEQLYFRIRVDKDPLGRNGDFKNQVWQVIIDSDSSNWTAGSTESWVLQLDAKDDEKVELELANDTDGAIEDVTIDDSSEFSEDIADYARATAVGGTDFGNDADFFIDIAIDFQDFTDATGLTTTDSFSVALATSDKDNELKKDFPFELDKTDSLFDGGFSGAFAANDAVVPEPGTWALFGLGMVALGMRVRRRKRAPVGGPVSV
jgi:hypothetical protein